MSRTAPDRCPGALRVHQALDGGLVRVRVPGGLLTAVQVTALASASLSLGDGCVDLTSRGNVQLRGLRPGTRDDLASVLTGSGLLPSPAHDTARNIVASPLASLPVASLDSGLCGSAALAALPGRFLLALSDSSADVLSLSPDLALFADQLVIGGRLAGPGSVASLLAAAEVFLDVRPGQEWRLAEVHDGAALVSAALGRTLGAVAPVGAPVPVGPAGDGRVVAHVPFGRLTPTHLRVLASVPGGVTVTPWRSVVVDASVDLRDFVTDPTSPWVGLTACVGSQCASSLADVRAEAVPSAEATHWSGCSRRCGKPAGSLDMVASADGYVRS